MLYCVTLLTVLFRVFVITHGVIRSVVGPMSLHTHAIVLGGGVSRLTPRRLLSGGVLIAGHRRSDRAGLTPGSRIPGPSRPARLATSLAASRTPWNCLVVGP